MTFLYHIHCLLFLLSLSPTFANTKFDQLISEKRAALNDIAAAIQPLLNSESLCQAPGDCNDLPCTPHACARLSFGKDMNCSNLVSIIDQEERCKESCRPEDTLLNLEQPFLSNPPGLVKYSNRQGPQNFLLDSPSLVREACALKSAAQPIKEAFNKHSLQSWLYAGLTSGTFMVFPGNAFARPSSTNSLAKCGFIPQHRPWYIRAASGPKDIVFLFDTTALTSSTSRLKSALRHTLEGLDRRDFVAVVTFGRFVSILGDFETLRSASTQFTQDLSARIESIPASSGRPKMTDAFQVAFDLLTTDAPSSGCTKIIVLLSGREPDCFDNCLGSASQSECNCTSTIVKAVNELQEQHLSSGATRPVTIVSFTENAPNDAERVARTLVCEKNSMGIWHKVTASDRKETAMAPFFETVAATLFYEERRAFASEIYNDAFGLGLMFTMAMPVYSRVGRKLLAVAGVDVTVKEVSEQIGGTEAAISEINLLSQERRFCGALTERSSCEMQALRSGSRSGECADVLPLGEGTQESQCFQIGKNLFIRNYTIANWEDALSICESVGDGGSLGMVDVVGKNRFLSGMVSIDGSWIGLQAVIGDVLRWSDGSALVTTEYGFGRDVEEEIRKIHETENADACVSADRRGAEGNWNVESCRTKRDFVCELEEGSVAAGEYCASNNTFVFKETEYEVVNDVNCGDQSDIACSASEEGAAVRARPLCADPAEGREEGGEGSGDFDRFCCGGGGEGGEGSCGSGAWWTWLFVAILPLTAFFAFLICSLVATTCSNMKEQKQTSLWAPKGKGKSATGQK